nr:MAG TPA: hypothetical protein [Bacteriophage sp.]
MVAHFIRWCYEWWCGWFDIRVCWIVIVECI